VACDATDEWALGTRHPIRPFHSMLLLILIPYIYVCTAYVHSPFDGARPGRGGVTTTRHRSISFGALASSWSIRDSKWVTQNERLGKRWHLLVSLSRFFFQPPMPARAAAGRWQAGRRPGRVGVVARADEAALGRARESESECERTWVGRASRIFFLFLMTHSLSIVR
jgi:hypothetical protein